MPLLCQVNRKAFTIARRHGVFCYPRRLLARAGQQSLV